MTPAQIMREGLERIQKYGTWCTHPAKTMDGKEIPSRVVEEKWATIARQTLESADKASEWVSVSERLPERPKPVQSHGGWWVYRPGARLEVQWETSHPSWWKQDGEDSGIPITHWLDWEIPQPPKVNKNEV